MDFNTYLSINKIGPNKLQYTIRSHTPELPFTLPVERIWEAQIYPRTINALCTKIRNTIERSIDDPTGYKKCQQEITNFGQGLYDALFPKNQGELNDLRILLRDLKTPLLISTDAPDIYWELLYDSEEKSFWGMKYQFGRRLRVRNVPGTRPRNTRTLKCLLIADPNADSKRWRLPKAAEEAEKLKEWFIDKGVNCDDFLQGKEASFDSILERLVQIEYDIIHYAGHIVKDTNSNDYALQLNGNELFPARSIGEMVKGNPLVFLNGCWGGAGKGTTNAPDSVAGLTDAFLAAGAQVVVSSLFRIPDSGARAYAEKFYDLVLNRDPVGEAMRLARRHVQSNMEYAAAWASFIMYGDPCWHLEISEVDKCQELLLRIGLRRENFDVSSLRIIDRALEYGSSGGTVSTPHLFAAMIDGDDDYLRRQIHQQQIPAEKLRDHFIKAFGNKSSDKTFPDDVTFSDNVQLILESAWRRAKTSDQEISEQVLLRAFIEQGGGNTGKLLKALGVDFTKLFPDSDLDMLSTSRSGQNANELTVTGIKPGDEAVENTIDRTGVFEPLPKDDRAPATEPGDEVSAVQIGPLAAADCETEVWEALLKGAYIARREEQAHISTFHFTKGMLQHPNSLLTQAILAYGLPRDLLGPLLPPEEEKYALIVFDDGAKIDCSESVFTILHYAKKIAEQRGAALIQDRDLLKAFFYQGGGNTGAALLNKGVILQFILSEVFHIDGRLNLSLLSPTLQEVVNAALDCAGKRRFSLVGRGHFLFAWLNAAKGRLAEEVRKQGKDPEQLAEALFLRLPNGTQQVELTPGVRFLSPGLIRIFLMAEQEMASRNEKKITEEILLPLFIADGGGEGGKLLVEHGIKFSRMLHG